MSDQVRNRNVLFSKLDRDEELNLDEQEKLLEYMRDDLIKQRTIWRYLYSAIVGFVGIACLYGITQEPWGIMPNVVRIMTVGRYDHMIASPHLALCFVVCTLTVMYTLWPWLRICFYSAVLLPVAFHIFWIFLCQLRWRQEHFGYSLLPHVCILFPVVADFMERRNRAMWSRLGMLEEYRNKFKTVCAVFSQTIHPSIPSSFLSKHSASSTWADAVLLQPSSL